jgi:hypothetical protein
MIYLRFCITLPGVLFLVFRSTPSMPKSQRPSGSIPPAGFYASQSTRTPSPPLIPLTPPTSTPISNKVSGSQPYSSSVHTQDDESRRRLAQETEGLFLGPMPCSKFLEQFLPLASDARTYPKSKGAFDSVASQASERAMYKPFVCTDVFPQRAV